MDGREQDTERVTTRVDQRTGIGEEKGQVKEESSPTLRDCFQGLKMAYCHNTVLFRT